MTETKTHLHVYPWSLNPGVEEVNTIENYIAFQLHLNGKYHHHWFIIVKELFTEICSNQMDLVKFPIEQYHK